MMKQVAKRTITLAISALVASACAHGPGSWRGSEHDGLRVSGTDAPMCRVRVESAYDVSIEAGIRAGTEQHALGTLEPDDAVEIGVPCSYRAVTVFRLVRTGGESADLRLRPLARALDPSRTTIFTLAPTVGR